MQIFILSVFGIILVIAAWHLYCNNQTYNHRIRMIDKCSKWDLFNELDSVSYSQHLWYLMTFRDWRELYPKLGKLV
jgi:hypothetical protein